MFFKAFRRTRKRGKMLSKDKHASGVWWEFWFLFGVFISERGKSTTKKTVKPSGFNRYID